MDALLLAKARLCAKEIRGGCAGAALHFVARQRLALDRRVVEHRNRSGALEFAVDHDLFAAIDRRIVGRRAGGRQIPPACATR